LQDNRTLHPIIAGLCRQRVQVFQRRLEMIVTVERQPQQHRRSQAPRRVVAGLHIKLLVEDVQRVGQFAGTDEGFRHLKRAVSHFIVLSL
jgi:hypothetical protein